MKTRLYRSVNNHCPSFPKSPFPRPLDRAWNQQRVPAGRAEALLQLLSTREALVEVSPETVRSQHSPPERGRPGPHATPTRSVWPLRLSTSKLFCLNCAVCSTFQGMSVIPLRQKASHDILCFSDYCFILNTTPGHWRYWRNVLQPETLTLTCPQILPRPRGVWRLREPSLDSPPPGTQHVLISLESRHAATAHPTPHPRS